MNLLMLVFVTASLFAQTKTIIDQPPLEIEDKSTVEQMEDKVWGLRRQVIDSEENRANSTGTFMAGFQVLNIWVPLKWSLSYTHIASSRWSFEGELSRGSLGIGTFGFDLARVTETRYSLLGRRYLGNSFHFIIGAFKNDFEAKLGSKYVDRLTNHSVDSFRVKGLGITLGLGNRWQWGSGLTLGIDWFRMNVPLFDKRVENEYVDEIGTVRNTIQKVRDIPTFVLFGFNLGYTF